jgi:hypothetical protein
MFIQRLKYQVRFLNFGAEQCIVEKNTPSRKIYSFDVYAEGKAPPGGGLRQWFVWKGVCVMKLTEGWHAVLKMEAGPPATGYSTSCQTILSCCSNRKARRKDGTNYMKFSPALSSSSAERIGETTKSLRIQRQTGKDINEMARLLNPKLRGWITYFGKFGKRNLIQILKRVNLRV